MQKIHFYFYKCIMDIFKLLYFTLLYLLLLKELLCNRQQGCTLMKTTDFFWRKLQKEDDNEVSLQKENATKSKVKKKNQKKAAMLSFNVAVIGVKGRRRLTRSAPEAGRQPLLSGTDTAISCALQEGCVALGAPGALQE